jgi:hypothetical protein
LDVASIPISPLGACQATLAYSLRQVALLAALLVLANGSAVPGFNGHGGTPIAGWFMMENPQQEWMIWGTIILHLY